MNESSISLAKSVALFVEPNKTPCITHAGKMKSRKLISAYGNPGIFTALLNCDAYTAARSIGKNKLGAHDCGCLIIPKMLLCESCKVCGMKYFARITCYLESSPPSRRRPVASAKTSSKLGSSSSTC